MEMLNFGPNVIYLVLGITESRPAGDMRTHAVDLLTHSADMRTQSADPLTHSAVLRTLRPTEPEWARPTLGRSGGH